VRKRFGKVKVKVKAVAPPLTDRRTDERQTVTLRLSLDAAIVKTGSKYGSER